VNEEWRKAGRGRGVRWLLLGAGLLALILLALFFGRYPEPFWTPPVLLVRDELARRLVLNLRLPRALTAVLTGMSLGGAGLVLQMIFRNPLVEPGFLGVSQGAAFGAALGILILKSGPLGIELLAAAMALLGLVLSYALARRMRYGGWVLRLILAGIAVSAMFSAAVGLLKYLADPLTELPEITFWLLGGLWNVTWRDFLLLLGPVLVGLLGMLLMRWRLNLLTLSDEAAFSLGAQLGLERALLLVAAVLSTAAVTAVAGIVGWVGLITPHIARRMVGVDARASMPAAMITGGGFVLLCDSLARTLIPGEIPLGIMTSFFGAAGFAALMVAARVRRRP
jgi:iron complex transport system permease protein